MKRSKVPRIAVIVLKLGLLALVPTLWNACGNVDFTNSSANYMSCSAVGADLGNCFDLPKELVQRSQTLSVQSRTEVDILFVIDNSASMSQEQAGIGNKINGFLDKVKNLNWQLAVTTTDPNPSTTGPGNAQFEWGDGQFRPFDSDLGSQFILRSSQVNPAEAQSKLASAIQFGTSGASQERGIHAVYRSVERSMNPSSNQGFFRPTAGLAVVLVSDEDECSRGLSSCPSASRERSDPAKALSFLRTSLGAQKPISFSSIVFIPGDTSCTTGANEGDVYKEITNLTGGALGSVCANDFTTPLSVIGQKVVDLVNSITLSCNPQDVNNDGSADVSVRLAGGASFSSSYIVSGNNVNFAQSLPEGQHSFHYFCKP